MLQPLEDEMSSIRDQSNIDGIMNDDESIFERNLDSLSN